MLHLLMLAGRLRRMFMFFKSDEHRERFLATIQSIGKAEKGLVDSEYGAAIYILTIDSEIWNKAYWYVGSDGVQFDAMLHTEDFSTSYKALINFAWNLFNEGVKVNLTDLVILDTANYKAFLTALEIRRKSQSLERFKTTEEVKDTGAIETAIELLTANILQLRTEMLVIKTNTNQLLERGKREE